MVDRIELKRRAFLQIPVFCGMAKTLVADDMTAADDRFAAAVQCLRTATDAGAIHGAAMYVSQLGREQMCAFGTAESVDSIFLIASISKPMTVGALLTLYDAGELQLDDPVDKYIAEFSGDGREQILVSHLLTHVSGLPDQLPDNASLRMQHAPLADFVAGAIRTPLLFTPGTKYAYSSMGILLAAEIAQRISGTSLRDLMAEKIFKPLEMRHSALGLGNWEIAQTMTCQVESAAKESGAGDPRARDWDWNSRYWRDLGAPWGGVHSSAGDVARFFRELMHPSGKILDAQTAAMMVQNQHRSGLPPRGFGFGLGKQASSQYCSAHAFGHTGSTGTLAWADPSTDTVCVILTTLPGGAATPHPRAIASDHVARAVA
jgi:CubicO group peptidase (beta-lactamase class C family)